MLAMMGAISFGAMIGIGIGVVVVLVVIVVVVVGMKGKEEAPSLPAAPAQAAPSAPAPVAKMAPAPLPMAPEPAPARPAPAPVQELRPATLQVEALSPSMTDESPMLGAEDGEMKMGTDELPKFGTDELPRVGTAQMPVLGSKFRTPAAQQLSQAIATGNCPKCKAPTFVGAEVAQGDNMFQLEARCGACGHKAKLIDMKV